MPAGSSQAAYDLTRQCLRTPRSGTSSNGLPAHPRFDTGDPGCRPSTGGIAALVFRHVRTIEPIQGFLEARRGEKAFADLLDGQVLRCPARRSAAMYPSTSPRASENAVITSLKAKYSSVVNRSKTSADPRPNHATHKRGQDEFCALHDHCARQQSTVTASFSRIRAKLDRISLLSARAGSPA